eukprot:551956_1
MRTKDRQNAWIRCVNIAFATTRSRQIIVLSLITSILLNLHFILFYKKTINYDTIDHYNAAKYINYNSCNFQNKALIMKEINWDLIDNLHAICLCGKDNFCRCGPSAATDIIAFTPDMKHIILVDRDASPFGLAAVGGFVEIGESIEDAAKREFKEETNLDIDDLIQVHTYSNPHQDPRRPSLSTVFIAKIKSNDMHAGDDAKGLLKWSINDAFQVENNKWDHKFGFEIHRKFIIDSMNCAIENNWIDSVQK